MDWNLPVSRYKANVVRFLYSFFCLRESPFLEYLNLFEHVAIVVGADNWDHRLLVPANILFCNKPLSNIIVVN